MEKEMIEMIECQLKLLNTLQDSIGEAITSLLWIRGKSMNKSSESNIDHNN